MNTDDLLARAFQDALDRTSEWENALWLRFAETELPEKQAWSAFALVMVEASARLDQTLRWAHRAASVPVEPPAV